jgi:ketosteroid isomerase-like protein
MDTVVRADTVVPELISRYYTLVDADDPAMFELFHQDIEYKRPGYPLLTGLDELRHFYRVTRVITRGEHRIGSLFCSGRQAAVEGRFTGVLRDGSEADLHFSDFFDVAWRVPGERRSGAVIRSRRTYFDDVRV